VRVVAGVDEAGLGPLLGPLVLGWSAFRLPEPGADLWSLLDGVVARDPKRDLEHIVVDDSKRVFSRNARGRRRLEATALSFLSLLCDGRKPPADARFLLEGPLAPDPVLVARHPWYASLPERLPQHLDAGGLELRAERVHRALVRARAALLDAGVRVVPAGELNASYGKTGSKARTLFVLTATVLRRLWECHAAEGLRVIADQQGARTNYGKSLADAFPDAEVRLVHKEDTWREYELLGRADTGSAGRRMRVVFAVKADGRSFATALGSCLAKYARETCMAAFNSWFAGLQPELSPTAGYTTDGRRWLVDARPALERAGLPSDVLVRER
jgi:ribonuclease HII